MHGSQDDMLEIRQTDLAAGGELNIKLYRDAYLSGCFDGPVDPTAKYLILTIDGIAGMTDLNWRYDLQ